MPRKEYHQNYYKANKDTISETQKAYYKNNKEAIEEYRKAYYEKNKQQILEKKRLEYKSLSSEDKNKRKEYQKKYHKEYAKANKDILAKKQKEYEAKNKEALSERRKKHYEKNKHKKRAYEKANSERISKSAKKRYELNKDARLRSMNEYRKKRCKTDIGFRILSNCRTRVYAAVKGHRKSAGTMNLVGCTIDDLLKHLESQFTDGMTWENYGKWHIDHIIPCASFDFSVRGEQLKCFNYLNLQPLWAEENIKKSTKIIKEEILC